MPYTPFKSGLNENYHLLFLPLMKLSSEDWHNARTKWELDPRTGYQWLSLNLRVSRPCVAKKARGERWIKRPRTRLKGRPTKYTPLHTQQIIDYFKEHAAYEVLEHPTDPTQKKVFLIKPKTLTGFAAAIGIDRGTLQRWANERDENGELVKPDFHDAYNFAKTCEVAQLLEGGLAGVYNSNITKLMLKNHHGYRDVQVNETEVYISKDIEESLNKLYEQCMKSTIEAQAAIEGRFERIAKG